METPAPSRDQQKASLKNNIAAIQRQLGEDAEGGRYMDEQERIEAEHALEVYQAQLDDLERAA